MAERRQPCRLPRSAHGADHDAVLRWARRTAGLCVFSLRFLSTEGGATPTLHCSPVRGPARGAGSDRETACVARCQRVGMSQDGVDVQCQRCLRISSFPAGAILAGTAHADTPITCGAARRAGWSAMSARCNAAASRGFVSGVGHQRWLQPPRRSGHGDSWRPGRGHGQSWAGVGQARAAAGTGSRHPAGADRNHERGAGLPDHPGPRGRVRLIVRARHAFSNMGAQLWWKLSDGPVSSRRRRRLHSRGYRRHRAPGACRPRSNEEIEA
jgi:hypothetical protein